MADMMRIGTKCIALTGGIASGKSTVARILHDLGAHIVDTDLIARKVVEPGMPALGCIVQEFGKRVLNDDGTLNRNRLRDEIIVDQKKRSRLNTITHPEIMKIAGEEILSYQKLEDHMPIILDVPLLFEVGWNKFFPLVVLVYVPVLVQIERLSIRDKISRSKAEETIKAQMDIEDKKRYSRYVIDNSGSIKETERRVISVFNEVKKSFLS